MICPECLGKIYYDLKEKDYKCNCGARQSAYYMNLAMNRVPLIILGAVGYRAHGKTVYMTILFWMFEKLVRRELWKGAYFNAINKNSLENVNYYIAEVEKGNLPESTYNVFRKPVVVEMSKVPVYGHKRLILFDRGGEVYEDPDLIADKAKFLTKSNVVLFLVSLYDLMKKEGRSWPNKLHELLNSYILGVEELQGNIKNQNLIVALSKGDLIADQIGRDVGRYLKEGGLKAYKGDPKQYILRMGQISRNIDTWLRKAGCSNFLNISKDKFKRTEFCIFSSLGGDPAGPDKKKLATKLTEDDPKRVLDPILWALELKEKKGITRRKRRIFWG